MQPDFEAASIAAAAIRTPVSLEQALGSAAGTLREKLAVPGVSVSVKREGRSVRGLSGILGDGAIQVPLRDGEVDGNLTICGLTHDRVTALAFMITLALSARFLGESAQIDGLTGALNRRSFDERLQEEWQRAARNRTPLSILMIDIDYFKAYNDRRGHLAGDDALRRVAHAAAASLQRPGDQFARYGGEEFVVILPATDLAGATKAAEHIRSAVSSLGIAHPLSKSGRVTVSIGVAVAEPANGGTPDQLIAAADHELYRAKAAGRDRVAAPGYASAEAVPTTVPQPLSTLVGRDAELERIAQALKESALVTLTGPQGVGKTRLALAIAADHADWFEHVRFVDMLGTLDADDILARVKAVLGTSENTLIVLDGCERVTEACREALVIAEPSARVLATSRIPLKAPGECVVRIQPLDNDAARELFSHRARMGDITVDMFDSSTAHLLRRLGGLPLAIELAVSRLESMSPERLLAEVGDEAGTDSRRPTLTSLLSSAVVALDADQTRMLSAVSVFVGAFSSADAAAVLAPPPVDERRADQLLREIAARSLLDAASHDGVTRWRMIDPVRDAALSSAASEPVRAYAIAAHLRLCAQRFRTFDERFGRVENQDFVRIVEPYALDFQVALERALDDKTLLADGLELCWAAGRYWFATGQIKEARARCNDFLDRAEGQDKLLHVRLLLSACRLAFVDGDITAMESYARSAQALVGDEISGERSSLLNYLGIAAKFRGEYDVAEQRFLEGKELNERLGNRRGEAIAIGALGSMAVDVRLDAATGARLYAASAEIFRELHDSINHTVMSCNLAEALTLLGDLEKAEAIVTQALAQARIYRNPSTLMQTLSLAVYIKQLLNKWDEAAPLLREALAMVEQEALSLNSPLVFVLCANAALAQNKSRLGAVFLSAADIIDAERALPTQPIERERRLPIERALHERLSEREYAEAANSGKSLTAKELLSAAAELLQSV